MRLLPTLADLAVLTSPPHSVGKGGSKAVPKQQHLGRLCPPYASVGATLVVAPLPAMRPGDRKGRPYDGGIEHSVVDDWAIRPQSDTEHVDEPGGGLLHGSHPI